MCFTNVNEAGIRYQYFMYSTNKCTDFNKNITLKKKKPKKTLVWPHYVESFQGSTFCLFVMVQPWNIGVC